MAGHRDQRHRSEAISHIFGETRLAAAGRTLQQHRQLFRVSRFKHLDFIAEGQIERRLSRDEILEGVFAKSGFGHEGRLVLGGTLIGRKRAPRSPLRPTVHPSAVLPDTSTSPRTPSSHGVDWATTLAVARTRYTRGSLTPGGSVPCSRSSRAALSSIRLALMVV